MAWNEPGGDKNSDKNPWGDRNKEQQGPPDLDEVINKLKERFLGKGGGGGAGKGSSSGGGAPKLGLPIALMAIALVVAAVVNAAYVVEPADRGVVLRFGDYLKTTEPGFHFKWPFIDSVETVNVRSIQKKDYEAPMLTKDENIVKLDLGVQYRVGSQVEDARKYLFSTRNADEVLQEAARSAVREVVGKSNMDFVLKEGRSEIASRTKDILQKALDDFQTGLTITTVNLQDAQPPDEVQAAFEDAIRAREDKQRKINEAEQHANQVIPEARGQSARMLQEADAYREALVAQAEGEASRFSALLTEYEKAPQVTRERLYLETVEDALSSVSKVIVDGNGSNNLMYLPLDKLIGQAGDNQQPRSAPVGSSPMSGNTGSSTNDYKNAATDSRSRTRRRSREIIR